MESQSLKHLAPALVKARRNFSALIKNSTNPHFRSKYADLATCIDAVEPALLAEGIVMYQQVHSDSTSISCTTVFLHESGESLSTGALTFPAAKLDPQGFMSALTYARRGSICAACCLGPEDDDGNAASRPASKADTVKVKPAEKQAMEKPGTNPMDMSEIPMEGAPLLPLEMVDTYLDHINHAESMGDLKHYFAFAYKEAKAHNDKKAEESFTRAKDLRKTILEQAAKDIAAVMKGSV